MTKEIPGFFHDDPKMSFEDLGEIEILSESECAQKWTEYVSAANRHFMQMQDDEWPSKVVSGNHCWYHWVEDWNDDDFSEFSSRLQTIGIPDGSTLIVFWMKEIGLKTNWGVFRKNWGNFLYEDEGCILVLPEHEESLVLSNGSAWLGKRSAPKT
ncbi:MAG: DUF2947 domain-containing protein [Gammaproteobacteria bacterium]|nr:DUF2947 domain-containing protein [Gammaproteobacteria bacterium]